MQDTTEEWGFIISEATIFKIIKTEFAYHLIDLVKRANPAKYTKIEDLLEAKKNLLVISDYFESDLSNQDSLIQGANEIIQKFRSRIPAKEVIKIQETLTKCIEKNCCKDISEKKTNLYEDMFKKVLEIVLYKMQNVTELERIIRQVITKEDQERISSLDPKEQLIEMQRLFTEFLSQEQSRKSQEHFNEISVYEQVRIINLSMFSLLQKGKAEERGGGITR